MVYGWERGSFDPVSFGRPSPYIMRSTMSKSVKSAVKSALKPKAAKTPKATKRSVIIDIMTSNADKGYDYVIEKIATSVPGYTVAKARSAYTYLIRNGFVKGVEGRLAPKKATKRSVIIDIITANADKSFDDVMKLIAQRVDGYTAEKANQAYRFLVRNAFVKDVFGVIGAPRTRAVKAAKKPKAPKTTLSADAKKDRLALIKEVGSRRKAAGLDRAFDGKRGRPMTDDEAAVAKEEISEMMNELDSFKAPKFLTKAQVRALV